MKFLLQKFLCYSLQTGTVVVGIFSSLSATAGFIKALETLSIGKSNDENMDDDSEEDTGPPTYSIVLIIFSLLMILVAILVLIAAWKNDKHKLLLPWLIVYGSLALTGICFNIYYAIWYRQEVTMVIAFAVASVVIAAIGIFCWLVVLSYYFELRKVKNKKNIP